MEIVVTGRHAQISDRFREHLDEKLAKVPQLAPRMQRLDVVVTHEVNPRQAKESERVEITCHVKGPVIRAEACADDKYAALDAAIDKLFERLRRMHDRKRVHRGRHVPESVAHATARSAAAALPGEGLDAAAPNGDAAFSAAAEPDSGAGSSTARDAGSTGTAYAPGAGGAASPATDAGANPAAEDPSEGLLDSIGALDSPIEVRVKEHATSPMSLDQALYEMELVGHDFYLFHCVDTDRPSVVYRRRGWSYGVIRLAVRPVSADEHDATSSDAAQEAAGDRDLTPEQVGAAGG